MQRRAWWATVHGVARVRHDWATQPPPHPWTSGRALTRKNPQTSLAKTPHSQCRGHGFDPGQGRSRMPNGMANKDRKNPSLHFLPFPKSLGIHAPFSRVYLRARRQCRPRLDEPGCRVPRQPGRADTQRTIPVTSQCLNLSERNVVRPSTLLWCKRCHLCTWNLCPWAASSWLCFYHKPCLHLWQPCTVYFIFTHTHGGTGQGPHRDLWEWIWACY